MKNLKISILLFWGLLIPLYTQSVSTVKKNILVIHSYHQGLQWTDEITQGIKEVFKDDKVEVHYEYLDTKRNSGEAYYQKLIEFEKQKKNLQNIDFELVICSDNNAFRFMLENGDQLYPSLPVVFCGVNNFDISLLQGKKNFTGVSESIDYASTLNLIKKIHPQRKNITLILDRTPTGEAIANELRLVIHDFEPYFSFVFLQDFILNDVPGKLASLDDDDAIILLTFNRDREGSFISYDKGISMIHEATDVPIYGSWDFYFGYGIVGGMLTSGRTQGREAALMAQEILKGTPVEEVKILYDSPNTLRFDYRELERFNINEKDLPPGSHVEFKPKRDLTKIFPAIVVFILLTLSGLIILTFHYLQQRSDKRKLEKELALLEEIIPICSHCKNIRDDQGYWKRVESYISQLTHAQLSHSLCPECIEKLYPDEASEIKNKK
jgi:ABC-type uncharacterized transport system substrate-binding protein